MTRPAVVLEFELDNVLRPNRAEETILSTRRAVDLYLVDEDGEVVPVYVGPWAEIVVRPARPFGVPELPPSDPNLMGKL